jgi:integrase
MSSDKRVTVWIQQFNDRPFPVLQWIDPETGKRKSKTAGTADPKEAELARADLEYELNHGQYQEASNMAWGRFRELFEQEFVAARRHNTRENYFDTLDAFERVCRPATVKGITERTLSAFAAGLRREKLKGKGGTAPSTIKIRLQFLRTALRWATDQKIIPACPRFPTVKVPKRKPKPVSADDFTRLLNAAGSPEMRAFLLCGWLAGLRLVEAWSLEWESSDKVPWVDLVRERIVLPAELVKGDEDQTVPLDPELRAVLEALPRVGRRVFNLNATAAAVGKRIVNLAKAAGVKLSMRSLRRGFACEYAAHVPAQVLQALMRHRNIGTTMAYYANTEEAAADAVRQRNSRRNNGNTPGGSDDATAGGEKSKGNDAG